MKNRRFVGVWGSNLQAWKPRGVQRLAREIASRFRFRKNYDIVVIIDIQLDSGIPYVRIAPLAKYLAAVPWKCALVDDALSVHKVPVDYAPLESFFSILSFECFEDL